MCQLTRVCTYFTDEIERNRARTLIVESEFEAFDKALLPFLSQELVNVVVGKRVAPLVDGSTRERQTSESRP